MKKTMRVAALLLLVLLMLTGCKPNEVVEEEPTSTPIPTATPVRTNPTLEPLVTAQILEGTIEEPVGSATPMLIHPIDLPAITFTYEEVSLQKINITCSVPTGWVDISTNEDQNQVIYQEPLTTRQGGSQVQSTLLIAVQQKQSAQTLRNAEEELNNQIEQLKREFPSLRVTSASDARLLNQTGRYISYWVEHPYGEDGQTQSMRGRLHVTPVNRKLYVIRTMHPADFNVEYDEIYKAVRPSIKEL